MPLLLRTSNMHLEIGHPHNFSPDAWAEAQAIDVPAWSSSLLYDGSKRTPEDIERLCQVGDFATYLAEHQDPGERFTAVTIRNPLVAMLRYGKELMGYGTINDEVSGSDLAKAIKLADPTMRKYYARLGGISMAPKFQGQEFGTMLAYTLAATRRRRQTLVAYFFDEHSFMRELLMQEHFKISEKPDEREEVQFRYFGFDRPPVDQYRATIRNGKFVDSIRTKRTSALDRLARIDVNLIQ